MTVSTAQYVDLLVKKIEGVAKTDTAANKSPSNESIASPLLNRGDTCWTQANLIPPVAAAVTDLVQAYTGVDAVECTADITTVPIGGVYPTWLTNLTDWIPQEFGATYFIKAYVDNAGAANPQSTGTQIFDSGIAGVGEWYFDYQAGLLNFIGQTIPAVLTSTKRVYIVGYRYVGLKGVQNLGNITVGNIFTDGYYYANGTPFSGGGSSYGNANVADYLASGNVTSNIVTSASVLAGNITINTANISTTDDVLTITANNSSWTYSTDGVASTPVGVDAGGVSSQQYVKGSVTTVEGDVNATSVGNAEVTIWTSGGANIVGGSMRLCVQSYTSGNALQNYNVEMMEVSFAKEWGSNANAFYVISDRVQTNITAPSANVRVVLNGSNALSVIASVDDSGDHHYTYAVTEFDNTPNA